MGVDRKIPGNMEHRRVYIYPYQRVNFAVPSVRRHYSTKKGRERNVRGSFPLVTDKVFNAYRRSSIHQPEGAMVRELASVWINNP